MDSPKQGQSDVGKASILLQCILDELKIIGGRLERFDGRVEEVRTAAATGQLSAGSSLSPVS
jgi:hypothetical protein